MAPRSVPASTPPLFVDTSAWFDLVFAGSPCHQVIADVVRAPGARFVTSTYVLAELTALLLVRANHALAARAVTCLRAAPEVQVVHPDEGEELRAWALFLQRPDKSYTLTDCLSFVIMRRLALTTALATDDHFRQEGFLVVP